MKTRKVVSLLATVIVVISLLGVFPVAASTTQAFKAPKPKFSNNVAFDISPTLRDMAAHRVAPEISADEDGEEIRDERMLPAADNGFLGDGAVQTSILPPTTNIPSPIANFEGVSNQANFNLFGFRVNPPDPVGDVGPNHYVEMVNLAFAIYDKSGNLLLGPVDTGTLWSGFSVSDCTDPSGDPVVLYDQFADRWLLTQFTTRGPKYYDCVCRNLADRRSDWRILSLCLCHSN